MSYNIGGNRVEGYLGTLYHVCKLTDKDQIPVLASALPINDGTAGNAQLPAILPLRPSPSRAAWPRALVCPTLEL